MVAVLTETGIANLALDACEEDEIEDIDGNDDIELICRRAYDYVLPKLLASHDWKFAKKRAEIASSVPVPAFEWDLDQLSGLRLLLLRTAGFRGSFSGARESPFFAQSLEFSNTIVVAAVP